MALIKCSECGKEISDKANTCPNCGCPIEGKVMSQERPSPTGMNICPKCGNFIIGKEKCPDCGATMVNCHCSEEDWTTMLLDNTLTKWETQMRRKYVVDSEEFDSIMYDDRLKAEKDEDEYYKNLMEQSHITIECPYCHSTNTKKISGLSKAGSIALFGIFALGKTSKQWHCNNCDSNF